MGTSSTAAGPTPVRCPDCIGELSRTADGATCTACGAHYGARSEMLDLIGSKSQINTSELEVQDHVSDFYENARYRRPASLRYHEHTLELLLRVAPPRGAVLDCGCGNGLLFDFLSKHTYPITELHGIDLSFGMLHYARDRFAQNRAVRGELVRADACRLPFADASFDFVYARSLLHHLPDPSRGAAEIARVLKPGGTLVALDPNRTLLSDLPRAISRRGEHFDDDHKNFYLRELLALLGPNLAVRSVEFMGYLAYPLLGFPDLLDLGRFLPLEALAPALIRLDDALAHVPLLKRLGWGVILVATRV